MKVFYTACIAAAIALSAGAATAATVIYSDNFNRANSNGVGGGWNELEAQANDVRIRNNSLRLRDSLPGAPDAAAASLVIDATGFENLTVSFNWRANNDNENNDTLRLSYALDPAPAITAQGQWTRVFTGGSNTTNLFSESVSISPGADNGLFNLMFWTNVTESSQGNTEGFRIDNVVVMGDEIVAAPLPAGILLLGTGVLLGAGLRRRQRA